MLLAPLIYESLNHSYKYPSWCPLHFSLAVDSSVMNPTARAAYLQHMVIILKQFGSDSLSQSYGINPLSIAVAKPLPDIDLVRLLLDPDNWHLDSSGTYSNI